MRLAVAVLFVVAVCTIFVIPADHCTASPAGNQTDHLTGNNTLNATASQYNFKHKDAYNNFSDNGSDEYDDEGPGYDYSNRGAITGVILSSVGSHAVPNANVALLDEYGYLVNVPENPQLSSNATGNNRGIYMFYDVPYGNYVVTAEKEGVAFFAIVNLSSGTATANVVLPGYVETEPAYQEPLPPGTPAPAPRPVRYFIPITVGRMPAASATEEGLPFGLAAIGSICALILFTRRNGKA